MMPVMRLEINEFENNHERGRANKAQSQFFFQKNKINQYLIRLKGKNERRHRKPTLGIKRGASLQSA